MFTGPVGQTIVFDPAVDGRTDLATRDVPPDAIAALLTGSARWPRWTGLRHG